MQKKYLILLLLLNFFSQKLYSDINAKAIIRVGCINITKVIQEISSDSVLKEVLSIKEKEILRKIQKKNKEIEKLQKIIKNDNQSLSAERVESVLEQVYTLRKEVKQLLLSGKNRLAISNKELSDEARKSIYKHIKQIAELNGFSIILETASVIYNVDEVEITQKVIKSIKKEKEKIGFID